MVSRKLLRWSARLAVLLSLVTLTVFVTDLWYDFLPPSIQTHLPMHPPDPIVVDLEIRSCSKLSSCDSSGTKWHRIPKDLYLGTSWTRQAYVYTKTVNENELEPSQKVVLQVAHGLFDINDLDARLPKDVINDIAPVAETPSHLDDRHAAFRLAESLGWRLRDKDAGLWVKMGKHEPGHAVTAVKVLYGWDAVYPVPSWTLCSAELATGVQDEGLAPRIAFKVGRQELQPKPKLKFTREGKLKIMQLADLHMSTGPGICDHPVPPARKDVVCKADERTVTFVDEALAAEMPDLVVFTGDQIYGDRSPDAETALLKALGPVLRREIPFAVVWGNHDHQGPLSNGELMDIVINLPNSLSSHGPAEVPGDGNYVVTASPANSDYPALTLYFMDSHSKLPIKKQEYDYIRAEQHDLMRQAYAEIHAKLVGYSHVPLSMAFFHIPLPEYRDASQVRVSGKQRENVIAPVHNSGTLQALRELGVSVMSVGHDHVNDFCQLQPASPSESVNENAWLCYGGGSGFAGYGGYADNEGDYKRRVRVFDINMNLPFIDTWHRIQGTQSPRNRVRLVDSGVAKLDTPSASLEEEENDDEDDEDEDE